MAIHYITLEDGTDFRALAKKMSDRGFVLNHATARNILVSALRKLFKSIAAEIEMNLSEEKVCNLLTSQDTHDSLQEVLFVAHKQLVEEGKI
jgi:hypothetical protein